MGRTHFITAERKQYKSKKAAADAEKKYNRVYISIPNRYVEQAQR